MSRAFDFTVATVLTLIAVIVHLMGVELFAPGSVLYGIATDGTQAFRGTARATLWFEIIVVWAPLATTGTGWVWALIREYKRQVQTAVRQAP
jgi:hypothetical protein